MTREKAPQLPAVVFGDLEADLWGVLLQGPAPLICVSGLSGAQAEFVGVEVAADGEGAVTALGPGLALRVAPQAQEMSATDPAGRLRPVSISGAITIDGSERQIAVDGLGIGDLNLDAAGSLRVFAGWFPDGRAVGLLAARAADAKGHDHDEIEVAALGEEHPLVLDPRLSTTYDTHHDPIRVGIELWLTDSSEADDQWSRRVAGLATGSRATPPAAKAPAAAAGSPGPLPGLSAHALRCVSRGQEGAGVYLLVRGS